MATFLEKHYHPRELARIWGVSRQTVQNWLEEEPEVLLVTLGYKRGKDHKRFFRVAESVARRVYEKHLNRKGLVAL